MLAPNNPKSGVVPNSLDILSFTTEIVSSYVRNNPINASDLTNLIRDVYQSLLNNSSQEPEPEELEAPTLVPAVSIRASVKQDYIVCLEDGKKLKMLKRYLKTRFNMTPEQYRERWNLPDTYPMTAPGYAEKRRELALASGLGKK